MKWTVEGFGPLLEPLLQRLDRIIALLECPGSVLRSAYAEPKPIGGAQVKQDFRSADPDRFEYVPEVDSGMYCSDGDTVGTKIGGINGKERCVVLWNALRYMDAIVEGAEIASSAKSDKTRRIAAVALEGGPLGHQGEIVDGVDRLSLSDLERASGAISRPEPVDDSACQLKACPACGGTPQMIGDKGFFVVCESCRPIIGPKMADEKHALIAWNAVVDAWSGGFAAAEGK